MATFPTGIASKPANITDGLQILAAHVGTLWDEVVAVQNELLGASTGSFTMDLRPSSAGSVVIQSRQAGDSQPRFQLTGGGDLRWGPGNAATDVTLSRTGTRNLTLTGTETIVPGNSNDRALLLKGAPSQTQFLLEVQDSTAASKFSITAAGVVTALTVNASTALTAPTLSPGTNTTGVATTAFVQAAISAGTPSGIPVGSMMAYGGSAAPAGWLLCDGSLVSRTGATLALFGAIGTTYGAGDGSTTFNLPDTRSKGLIGAGTGAGLTNRVLGTSGGTEKASLTVQNMPTHDHGGTVVAGNATVSLAATSATGTVNGVAGHAHNCGLTVYMTIDCVMAVGGSTNNPGRFYYGGTGGGSVSTASYQGTNPQALGQTDLDGGHAHSFTPISHNHTLSQTAHAHTINPQGSGTAFDIMQPWLATNWIIKT